MATVFKDMELDDEDKMDLAAPCTAGPMVPNYPWGLRITLTEKELKKLSIDPKSCTLDGMLHLHAMAKITCVSEESNSGGDTCRVEMQIQQLAVESEDAENEEAEEPAPKPVKPLRSLYSSKKE